MTRASHRSLFLPLMAGLVLLSWGLLFLWGSSSYGRYLNHGTWDDRALIAALCQSLPAGELVLPLVLYVGGWVLMLVVMMLPTTLPLLEIFRRLTRKRPDAGRLMLFLIAGYLGIWTAFGVVAHALDWGLFQIVSQSSWLQLNGWVMGAVILFTAGLFQFSPLKYRCLEKCRTPLSFVVERWRGRQHGRQAFLLGVHHGLFCVGCCWALMMLMFVVGTGNLGWMLVLAVLMGIEKNTAWGQRISVPLGLGLLFWAGLLVYQNLLSGPFVLALVGWSAP
ncbi:DUF2182 domain-containing protein [Sneathiella chinensis]|uniref:DUF2182 domain-containing protein n=1 Tax=Sneathiella chinensis TaxID=349750 RepID=A0ABQ5U516_9PROT|nr:DUF2182 domain-containing protein [Sneathiella chinensis]GLQ06808.1 hypothetical protein GCM10007924_20290 [Sneathiella chinensis]